MEPHAVVAWRSCRIPVSMDCRAKQGCSPSKVPCQHGALSTTLHQFLRLMRLEKHVDKTPCAAFPRRWSGSLVADNLDPRADPAWLQLQPNPEAWDRLVVASYSWTPMIQLKDKSNQFWATH